MRVHFGVTMAEMQHEHSDTPTLWLPSRSCSLATGSFRSLAQASHWCHCWFGKAGHWISQFAGVNRYYHQRRTTDLPYFWSISWIWTKPYPWKN